MGRVPRTHLPDGFFHVTARGVGRAAIFRDDLDYADFRNHLLRVAGRYRWTIHAYCLMPNHYHLLIETQEANLSAGMHAVNARYARMFNAAHERVGHVFQQRFHAQAIVGDEHLLEAMRYIALNPVRAGFAKTPGAWRWSSHRAMAGACSPPRWLARDRALGQFAPGGADAYLEFVAEGGTGERPRRETQAEMAARLGVSQATVSRLLRRE
jgi:putative transposase